MTFSTRMLWGLLMLACGSAVVDMIRPTTTTADSGSISLPIETDGGLCSRGDRSGSGCLN